MQGNARFCKLSNLNNICNMITITKTYNDNALFEDLKALCIRAGVKGESVTFIFTDAEIKSEGFLEYMNSLLATGEVVGLFAKDEKDAMCGDVRNDFVKDNPNMEEPTLGPSQELVHYSQKRVSVITSTSEVSDKSFASTLMAQETSRRVRHAQERLCDPEELLVMAEKAKADKKAEQVWVSHRAVNKLFLWQPKEG
eukprot:Skav221887  [mRNA]  locus=scaffold1395:510124:521707:+ [translate_table: standard]